MPLGSMIEVLNMKIVLTNTDDDLGHFCGSYSPDKDHEVRFGYVHDEAVDEVACVKRRQKRNALTDEKDDGEENKRKLKWPMKLPNPLKTQCESFQSAMFFLG